VKNIKSIQALLALAVFVVPLIAQFGQNIVQYDRYDWHYIQSPYFDIYFYGDNQALAEFASEVADESYQQISDRLNWELQKRVAIMVYQSHADFQQTNVTFQYNYEGIGGVTELFKNRVVVPFEGSNQDFRHVIRHELLHAMLNDMIYGGNVQSIISGRIRYAIPGWMNEGLAEYLAGGWDANSDMYMRDLAVQGDIQPVNRIGGYYAYRAGQSLWRFLTRKYGEESIAEIFGRIKMKGSVEEGVRSTLGEDYRGLSEQWEDYLKKEYWPDVVGRTRLKDLAHRVTDHEKLENTYNIAPAISPDGSKLALMRNEFGTMEIVLISATDGRFLKRLIRGGSTAEYEELHLLKPGITWSPDGKRVAFTAKAADQEILYVVNIKTRKTKKYPTGLEGLFMAAWSPDGEVIALIGNNGRSSDLYLFDVKTKNITNLTDDVFSVFYPSWSPDGKSIAFSSDRGDYPVHRFDNEGNQYNYEQRTSPVDGSPLNSVKPRFKLFDHEVDQLDVFMIDRDGSNLRRITHEPAREKYPVFAHAKPFLYYTSDRSGVENIYMLNLETQEERAVTNVLTGISDLDMATDDSRLYFTGFEYYGYDIYRIHNPLELWDQPKDIPTAKYLLDTTKVEDLLVNTERDRNYPITGGGYQNYIFGMDNPSYFTEQVDDSVYSVELEEDVIKDEVGMYRIHPYKTRFTLDLVQSYAGYSTLYSFQGMTQFMFSDMLGNHRISIATEMQISLENSDYFLTYHLLPFRTNYYFTLFHTAYFFSSYSGTSSSRLRNYGLDMTSSLPLDRFRRLDIGLTANTVEHTDFVLVRPDLIMRPINKDVLATLIPRVGYVWDNAEWEYLHPVNGWRTNFWMSGSPKWNDAGIAFLTTAFDLRRYFRLFAGTSTAFRLTGGASFGPDAQNFLVGGLPWIFSSEREGYYGGRYKQDPLGLDENRLKTIYFSEYVTPLRGAQMMEIVGQQALLLNMEYRFPFLLYYFPALRILGQLSGVAFIDAGFVWDESTSRTDQIITYGWGPRFIFLGLPFQLDYAWPFNPPEGEDRSRHWYLTIGLDF
jgi:Tol biopolymer transport system component